MFVRLEDLGIDDLTKGTLYPQVRTNSFALFAFISKAPYMITLILFYLFIFFYNADFMITSLCMSLQPSRYLLGSLSSLLRYFLCDGWHLISHILT